MIQQFHSWVYIWKKKSHKFENIHAPQCSKQMYLQQPHMEAIHMSINRQINKMWSSIQWTMSAIRKNKILPFAATCMDLENSILHKIYQTEKDKYYMKSYE